MEDFVNNVRNFSSQGQFSQLCEYMNKSWNLLTKNVSNLDAALEALDLQQHSLGMLYILCVKVSLLQSNATVSQEDFEQVFSQVMLFTGQCIPEQIQYSTGNFAQMFHTLTHEFCRRNMAIRGIKLLCMGIAKAQAHSAQLTSLHSDLCQLCLSAKCLKPALPYLDTEICDISRENGMYDSKHFLTYYYYGGMIYSALKRFRRALYFFEQVVVCPASTVSQIMLEAYKKYVLVSLIAEGKCLPLPKFTSQVILRYVKQCSGEYNELAQAHSSGDPAKLAAVISTHSAVFTADKNLGLVKQVSNSLNKRNIQSLTKTFITLSLSDVATRARLTGPEQAEFYLRQMIEDGEIFSTIDQTSEMVSFYDDPKKYNTASMLKEMDRDIQNFTELDRKLREMDQSIQVNPMYVQKVKNVSTQEEEFELTSSASSSSRPASILSRLMFK